MAFMPRHNKPVQLQQISTWKWGAFLIGYLSPHAHAAFFQTK